MTKHKGVCFMLTLLCSLLHLGGEKKRQEQKFVIKFKRKKCGLSGYNAQGCGLDK